MLIHFFLGLLSLSNAAKRFELGGLNFEDEVLNTDAIPDQQMIDLAIAHTPKTGRAPISLFRVPFFLGEYTLPKNKNYTSSEVHWHQCLDNPEPFGIKTKDGVILDSIYSPAPGASKTIIFFGGMLGGMMRYANFFRNNSGVNVLLSSRRGFLKSTGSSIQSGEIGIYYDVQAALTWLVREKNHKLEDIVVYGYCLGAFYATTAALYFPQIGGVIIDRGITRQADFIQRFSFLIPGFITRFFVNWILFKSGIKDPLKDMDGEYWLKPRIPYETSGMSNNEIFRKAYHSPSVDYQMPKFFFMYGLHDWTVMTHMSRNLHRAYLDDNRYQLNHKYDFIYSLNKAHQEFFMKNEPLAQKALLEYVEKWKRTSK